MPNETTNFLKDYPQSIQTLTNALREIILGELPYLKETIDPTSKLIAYGSSPKYAHLVCAIMPYAHHVNLMFSRGASMPDPEGLLEGTGKKARHIRVESLTDDLRAIIKKYCRAAAQLIL